MIRMLVVDDHPVVRAGMVALLGERGPRGRRRGRQRRRGARPGAEADPRRGAHGPADAGDGRRRGDRPHLRAEPDAPEVLVLTTYDTDADIVRAVESGARGYLLKDTPPAVLADAIRRAARGETVLAPPVAARLAERLRAPARARAHPARARRAAAAWHEGCPTAEIGRELFIGEATVKTHLLRIFAKLEVTDRTAAVTAAYRVGLITL